MKLLALFCPTCHTPLPAENDDLVMMCQTCRTTVRIDDRGVFTFPVKLVAPQPEMEATIWLPFWVYLGRVELSRTKQGGRGSAADQATQFWAEARRLYVPAWQISLQQARQLGAELIERQPLFHPYQQASQAPMAPAVLGQEDALKLLELMIIGIEAERPDYLSAIALSFDLGQPELWALPASGDASRWRLIAQQE